MPELPEVEHLRRSLEPHLIGARVRDVALRRRGIVRIAGTRRPIRSAKPTMLLQGSSITRLIRRGKSMAIVADCGGVLGVHLGMTGMLRVVESDQPNSLCGSMRDDARTRDRHVHCEWWLTGAAGQPFRLWFRDPRRFGGLYPFASVNDLLTHPKGWARLGPDALEIDARMLRERLLRTAQPIKAALLNQALIAGVGNIYADESLFDARIHPLLRPRALTGDDWMRLSRSITSILEAAIDHGGSSISDYFDAQGNAGTFGASHRVYGRGGEPCVACGQTLRQCVAGQRTTVYCVRCQGRENRRSVRRPGACPQPTRIVRRRPESACAAAV